jgi:hydrogenase maturation protease
MNTPAVRIFAWGNVGRGDDGVALVLLARLRRRLAGRGDVVCHDYHQLGPEVVDDLADCRLAIFIDAHVLADEADVFCHRVEPAERSTLDSHHCTPGELCALASALGLTVPPAYLVGIRGSVFDYADTLSSSACAALMRAEAEVEELLERSCCPV